MESFDTSAPGAQPAAPEVAPQEGVKPPEVQESPSTLDAFDSASLLAALEDSDSGEVREPAQPVPAAVIEEAPVAPAAVAEPEAEVVTPTVDTGGTGTETKGPQRVSLRSLPSDQQVQIAKALDLVRNGEATDMTDALLRVTGRTAPAAVAPAEGTTETPPAAPAVEGRPATRGVEEIKLSLKQLREERRSAIADYDREKESELTDRIEDLQLDLLRAEQAATVQADSARSYQQSYATAVDEMEAEYEEALDDNSAFSLVLEGMIVSARGRNDPRLKDPTFIKGFAAEAADLLGIAKKSAAAPSAPNAPATPAPARPSRPVGSGLAPGTQTAARPTPEQMSRMIHEMPIEDLRNLVATE